MDGDRTGGYGLQYSTVVYLYVGNGTRGLLLRFRGAKLASFFFLPFFLMLLPPPQSRVPTGVVVHIILAYLCERAELIGVRCLLRACVASALTIA
ncbi:unnamed protein product [Calypogeia fissa]